MHPRTKKKIESNETQMRSDPNDPYATKWREQLSKRYPKLTPNFANASVNQMLELVGFENKEDQRIYDNQIKKETLESNRAMKELYAQLKINAQEEKTKRDEEKAAVKASEALDKKVKIYKDDLQKSSIPALSNAIQQVQEVLPEKGDVPGFGATASVPDSMLSADGQKLRQRTATLFNITLKARSGAAVVDTELERLKEEFGSGKMRTDALIRQGIQSYIRRLQEVSKNITGGTPPEVIEKYQEQGGSNYEKLLQDYRTKSEPKPKTIIQNGHTYNLNPSTGKYE